MSAPALLGTILVLTTAFVSGQTAAGIHLVDVRFSGDTSLQAVDLRKCAAELESRTYEGPEWLSNLAEHVRGLCLQDNGYFKAAVTPSSKQLPDKGGTHQFVVTFDINAGSQYHTGQIEFQNNRVFSAEQLRSMFKLAPGEIFRLAQFRQGLARMQASYVDRRYRNFTTVPETTIDDTRHVISVIFDCAEGEQFR